MSGVRISGLPDRIVFKDIRIHFSKPENGGGPIKEIYYPLFDKDAVVIFYDQHAAEMVMHEDQILNGKQLGLKLIPVQIFPTIHAVLDDHIAEFINASPKVKEEITISGNVKFDLNKPNNKYVMTGNWYELESAWFYINVLMAQQQKIQHTIVQQLSSASSKGSNNALKSGRAIAELSLSNPHEKERTSSKSGEEDITELLQCTTLDNSQRSVLIDDRVLPLSSNESQKAHDRKGSRNPQAGDGNLQFQKHTGVSPPVRKEFVHRGMNDGPRVQNLEAKRDEEKIKSDLQPKKQDKSNIATTLQNMDENISKTRGNRRPISATGAKEGSQYDYIVSASLESPNDLRIIDDNPEDVTSLEFVKDGLKVSVYTGNITKAETETIVNPTRSTLIHKTTLASAISAAAGCRMQDECNEYFTKKGLLKESEVMHTSAGGQLNAKVLFILHTVGPVFDPTDTDINKCEARLMRTFLNCFMYANTQLQVRTLACPLISSGSHEVPIEVCVTAFFHAVLHFLSAPGVRLHLREIHLINIDGNSSAITVLQLRQVIESYQLSPPSSRCIFCKEKDKQPSFIDKLKKSSLIRYFSGESNPGGWTDEETDMRSPSTAGRPLPAVPRQPYT